MKKYGVVQHYRHPVERIEHEHVREHDDYEWAAYCSQIGAQIGKDFAPTDITDGALAKGRRLEVVVMTPQEHAEALSAARADAFRRGVLEGAARRDAELKDKALDLVKEFFD